MLTGRTSPQCLRNMMKEVEQLSERDAGPGARKRWLVLGGGRGGTDSTRSASGKGISECSDDVKTDSRG